MMSDNQTQAGKDLTARNEQVRAVCNAFSAKSRSCGQVFHEHALPCWLCQAECPERDAYEALKDEKGG